MTVRIEENFEAVVILDLKQVSNARSDCKLTLVLLFIV